MIEIIKISLITTTISVLINKEHSILSWYGKLLDKMPWYASMPLGGCSPCFTGQVMLWYYIFTKAFFLTDLLFYISASILCSLIFHKIYYWLW